MIELLEAAGAANSLIRLWDSLSSTDESRIVNYHGAQHNLWKLVRTQREEIAVRQSSRVAPVERSWSRALRTGGTVIVPAGDPPSSELAVVLICAPQENRPNSWHWQCVDWRTGQQRWENTSSFPIHSAVWSPYRLLIATTHGWQTRTVERGRPVWESTSSTESKPIFVSQADGTVWPAIVSAGEGVKLFDPENGQTLAQLKPAGQLNPLVGCHVVSNLVAQASTSSDARADNPSKDHAMRSENGSVVLSMQTLNPTRVWTASAMSPRERWLVEEISRGGEAWLTTPFHLDNQLFATMCEHRLVGYRLKDRSGELSPLKMAEKVEPSQATNSWVYRDFSYGFREPCAFVQDGQLLAVTDGSQLLSLDPLHRVRKWMSGLADSPLREPARQVCGVDGRMIVTSQGVLRAISSRDGSLLYEHYLGNTTTQWRTVVARHARSDRPESNGSRKAVATHGNRSIIAAWPVESGKDVEPVLWLCDAETGDVLQRFRLDAQPTNLVLDHEGFGILATAKTLNGLHSLSSKLFAATNPPSLSRPPVSR